MTVKLVVLYTQPEDPAAFEAAYGDVHVPLVEKIPGVQRFEAGRISGALDALTPRERMVFELKHYQGLKLRTVGEILNTTEETAKNTLFRATQKLRGALADMR